MDYVEADDRLFSLLEKHGAALFETIKTTAFPHTYRAMFGFCARTNALKTSMFDMIDSDNPYAFNALFRCYCEHYLKFTYIFIRFLKERSDDVGNEYFSYCGATEAREYASAIVLMEGLIGHAVVADVGKMLATLYPAVAQLSAAEVEAASGKFRYRSILRFIARETPLLGKQQPALARIVPMYARLSSFVHGGPSSEAEMYSYSTGEPIEKCRQDVELVTLMTGSVLLFTALAVSREYPQFAGVAASISSTLKDASDTRDSSATADRAN